MLNVLNTAVRRSGTDFKQQNRNLSKKEGVSVKYRVKQAFIVLDGNGDVIDYRDTLEEATALAEAIEQDDEDMWAINEAFEAVDN